jgi:GntR family transcriptional regulator
MEPLVLSTKPDVASRGPIAKYHLVEMTLAVRIRDGAYHDGLPGERELAAEFGVARVTIRSALKRLAQQGLVARRQRRGTVAVSGRHGPTRRLLRDHIDKFLDHDRPTKRKVIGFEVVPATPAVAQALDLEPAEHVLRVVRVRSAGATPITYTEVFVPARLARSITRTALNRRSFIEVLEAAGVRIMTADQSVGSEGAPPHVASALGVPLLCPMLKVRRVIRGHDGMAVQLLLGWYRADRLELRMQLSRTDDVTKVWVEYH